MPYQPHPMLPSDLRDFEAPSWWRSNAHLVWAGVFAALVAWDAVNQITGAGVSLERGSPTRSGDMPSTFAPSLDCPRLVRGQWLYASVRHDGDRMLKELGVYCYYGHSHGQRFIQ